MIYSEGLRGILSEIRFKIGEIVLSLVSDDDQDHFPVEESYRKFISTDLPLVTLRHTYGEPPDLSSWQPVFNSTGVWRLFRQGDHLAIGLYSPVYGPRPYQVTVVSSDFLSGSIVTSTECYPMSEIPFPLRYPLAEVLMIHLLAQGRGILLHACAVKDGKQGILFSGVSGAGKSTTAWLWENQPGAILLSDDRVILHRQANGFNIYRDSMAWRRAGGSTSQRSARENFRLTTCYKKLHHAVIARRSGDTAAGAGFSNLLGPCRDGFFVTTAGRAQPGSTRIRAGISTRPKRS